MGAAGGGGGWRGGGGRGRRWGRAGGSGRRAGAGRRWRTTRWGSRGRGCTRRPASAGWCCGRMRRAGMSRTRMRVSMAGVTAVLLRLHGHTDDRTEWQALLTWLPEPARTAAVDATAQFGAAIHTAHRLLGPKQPLLQYWCQAALASSSTIGQTMLDFVRARVVASPIILTGAQQRNLQQTIPIGVQQGWHYGYLDRAMLQALETTLVAAGQITLAEFRRVLLTAD